MHIARLTWLLGIAVVCAATAASCSDSGDGTTLTSSTGGSAAAGGGPGGGSGAGAQGGGGGMIVTEPGGSGGAQQAFDVQPAADQTLSVLIGETTPTLTYTATLEGSPVNAGWNVDKGNVAIIDAGPSSSATLAPTGIAGGVVTVSAGLNGEVVERSVLVQLHGEQNGPNDSPEELGQIATTPGELTAGGGIGGVGGEGLGQAVTDQATLDALANPTGDGVAQGLKLLYPYDATVWPRGLPAPLLQWGWSPGDADAIQIELSTTTGSFSWKGTFGRSAILAQTGGHFIRHPIPQDIWKMATNTAGGLGDQLTVALTVAQGGQGYGPIAQTWTVAPARLAGLIYYNSYGTSLAKNYAGALGGDGMFGGAVLSIHVGDTAPALVAGGNSATPGVTDATKCRVCHSVAADGSRLAVAHGESYMVNSSYDLSPSGATEQLWTSTSPYFPGVSGDGTLALTSSAQLLSLPEGTPLTATGLPAGPLGMPAFSPDGTRVAFNLGASNQLAVMAFDSVNNAFSAQTIVADETTMPGWPAFFPDGNSVVYEREVTAGGDGHGASLLWTRAGAKGQIAWTATADAAHTAGLNQLNGLDAAGNSYLPTLSTPVSMSCQWTTGQPVGQIDPDHGDDANLNYEPTVNPVASGGYAWVVFTSRRMYGNVATIPPFCSDPRWAALFDNITPKKLWVAAIDLSGQSGTDPSHPAFYLPAQEILAGNSRGYWTLNPCRPNGSSCETGDQCCEGFCQRNEDGELVCSDKPPDSTCSHLQEHCDTAADCCDTTNLCINGFCALDGPA